MVVLEEKISDFLSEDLGYKDITTDALIDEDLIVKASLIFNEDAIVAGLFEASKVFEYLGCTVTQLVKDGMNVKSKTIVLTVQGHARSILMGERVALNIIMRMSGVATSTNNILNVVKKINPKLIIAATRKTTPGLRYFEKRAVELGGGDTHRFRLDDYVLIKNNHLKIVGSIKKAIKIVKEKVSFTKKIGIEVEKSFQAIEAVEAGADVVMFDNMKPEEIAFSLKELKSKNLGKKVLIEVSGGINIDNIEEFAKLDIDIISLGYITHSVRSVDVNLIVI